MLIHGLMSCQRFPFYLLFPIDIIPTDNYCSSPFRRNARGHSIRHSILTSSLQVVGILCMQLLLHFYADYFETLQVFRPWSEDVGMLCMQIPLKLYRCLCHGLKMCILFGYNI